MMSNYICRSLTGTVNTTIDLLAEASLNEDNILRSKLYNFLRFLCPAHYWERLKDNTWARRQRMRDFFKQYMTALRNRMHQAGLSENAQFGRLYEIAATTSSDMSAVTILSRLQILFY